MCKATLIALALTATLAFCSAKPADVFAHVPSNFYGGAKWVLFRDDSIPDPPPNVIQAENGVQVLPSYRYQKPHFQGYVASHVTAAPVLGDFESEVVESKPHQPQQPQYETDAGQQSYDQNQGDYLQKFAKHQQHQFTTFVQHQPIVKVSPVTVTPIPFGVSAVTHSVTAVPHTAVHIEGPAYFDYLRKKKSTA